MSDTTRRRIAELNDLCRKAPGVIDALPPADAALCRGNGDAGPATRILSRPAPALSGSTVEADCLISDIGRNSQPSIAFPWHGRST
jgi:hypothetical protein